MIRQFCLSNYYRFGLFLATSAALFALGCSSGGSSGPQDPQGPGVLTINYCRVIEIDGEMHVQWNANHPTSGEFRYGREVFSSLTRFSDVADTHDIILQGLEWAAEYVYELRVFDQEQGTAVCDGGFSTPQKAQPEPVIMGLTLDQITEISARVSWRTDEPATTILYYGLSAPQDSIVLSSFDYNHTVTLSNLTPATAYLVRPEAVDTTYLRGYGRDTSFVTAARMTVRFDDTLIPLGETVMIPIYVEHATDLAALQYTLTFDNGQIEIVDLTEGPFYRDFGGFAFFRGIHNSRGELTNHMTWSIEYDGNDRVGTQADGDGVIANLSVRAIQPGNASLVFAQDSSFALDMFAATRVCSLSAGIITVP